MPSETKPIGIRVRQLRRERRLTQKHLADLLGITQGYLSKLESGRGGFSADQFLLLLRHFNITSDFFSPEATRVGNQIQNALARQGAFQLAEDNATLPSERLKNATATIREALVSGDSARQVAAVAPVLVANAGQINFQHLRAQFSELGLDNRLGWALENALAAIQIESNSLLPREWRLRYRRASLIIEPFLKAWQASPVPRHPKAPPQYDLLDPEITSEEAKAEVIAGLPASAKRWKIATRLAVADFVHALRGARGAD